ncbi:hypothetical protein [Microcoleus sp. M2_C2]|uniref:hypothetical protein n=1 Tax=Microcoleus sp. M2_C2 TaxID=3055369 RepID=UPI002FCFCED0
MTTPLDPLQDVPLEVMAFLAESQSLRAEKLAICPLDPKASSEYTTAIRATPVGAELRLVALDDANDSNPYCYIVEGPAKGMILHFSHDPEPELKFRSLASFKQALASAKQGGRHIDDLVPDQIYPIQEQDELAALLLERASGEDEVSEFFVCTLLPLLAPENLPVLEQLARHRSFVVREAVAVFVRERALPSHRAILERLVVDTYGQVARPAREALIAIRASHA